MLQVSLRQSCQLWCCCSMGFSKSVCIQQSQAILRMPLVQVFTRLLINFTGQLSWPHCSHCVDQWIRSDWCSPPHIAAPQTGAQFRGAGKQNSWSWKTGSQPQRPPSNNRPANMREWHCCQFIKLKNLLEQRLTKTNEWSHHNFFLFVLILPIFQVNIRISLSVFDPGHAHT